ncbi:MAG: LamG domain-containing protein, partial [Halioglobus sp.]|nr:LamG domain-containing protein [Halioglobus sp.]
MTRTLSKTNLLVALALSLALSACSGGSGGGGSEREVNPEQGGTGGGGFVYSGPAPATDEIQSFKLAFYDPLVDDTRCGECHTPGKSGTPAFVDQGNVNQAWQHAKTIVNLQDPASSAAVSRVANGHNCWLAAPQAATCAATIAGYIERWADAAGDSTQTINLTPRRPYQPAATRVLPPGYAEAQALGADLLANGQLLELLARYCEDCHSDTAVIPQVPYFASADVEIAYAALRGKVDLISPARSRVVQRLAPEGHNCWSDCDSNAQTLQSAVAQLAATIPATEVDSALLTSTAQVLGADGVEANTGGRHETDLIAKWEFREGSGTTTAD